jgi:hypothetical protein
MEGSVYLAAAVALESWAASLTETTISEKIGDYSYTKKSADSKLALAERMRALDIGTPAVAWAEPNITDITAEEEEEDI